VSLETLDDNDGGPGRMSGDGGLPSSSFEGRTAPTLERIVAGFPADGATALPGRGRGRPGRTGAWLSTSLAAEGAEAAAVLSGPRGENG
jgi:hypothetical protein